MRKTRRLLAILTLIGMLAATGYAAVRSVSATGRYYVIHQNDRSRRAYSGKQLKEYDGKQICAVSKGLLTKSGITTDDLRKERVVITIKKGQYTLSSRLAVDLNPSNSSIAEPYFHSREKTAIKQFEDKCNGRSVQVTLKK